jgi:hypothetical protein
LALTRIARPAEPYEKEAKKTDASFPAGTSYQPGHLTEMQEVQSLLQKYRSELVRQSHLLDQGDRA